MKTLFSIVPVLISMAVMSAVGFGQNYKTTAFPSNIKFTYGDGSEYYGEMKNGLPEGTGTVFYANGNLYRGGWKDHAPHGKGTMSWVYSKRAITAIWEAGKPVRILEAENAGQAGLGWSTIKEHPARIWAVVVGVGSYRSVPALKFADDDAYQFFSFLKSPQGGALPGEQITLLIDEDATRANIIKALRTSFGAAGKNDMVLFYFSGHGLPEAFLPTDYDGSHNSLFHEEIKELLKQCNAKHKLVIADACNAGGFFTGESPGREGPEKFYAAFGPDTEDITLLLSSRWNEFSLEDDHLRSGVFSHFLLRGLHGESDIDGNKVITITELYQYVNQNVRLYTNLTQTPFLTGNFDRTMPVAAVRPAWSAPLADF